MLLSYIDNEYFKIFFANPTTVQPPHEWFSNFIKDLKPCSNVYEKYRHIKDIEASLILPKSSQTAFKVEGNPPGVYEGTMRGSDPCLPKSVMRYLDSVRD